MEREDLGAMFAAITRRLVAAEQPILATHQLTMWEYIALTQLGREPAQSQLALARAIGHDKTRLIALLDSLEQRGLLIRAPDSTDRRSHSVKLTTRGGRLLDAARADIRAMEEQVLAALPSRQRDALLASLATLGSAAIPVAGPPSS